MRWQAGRRSRRRPHRRRRSRGRAGRRGRPRCSGPSRASHRSGPGCRGRADSGSGEHAPARSSVKISSAGAGKAARRSRLHGCTVAGTCDLRRSGRGPNTQRRDKKLPDEHHARPASRAVRNAPGDSRAPVGPCSVRNPIMKREQAERHEREHERGVLQRGRRSRRSRARRWLVAHADHVRLRPSRPRAGRAGRSAGRSARRSGSRRRRRPCTRS